MKEIRPLDDTDRLLVRLLSGDGRLSNRALASELGIAESTCLARLKSLRERGVITGVHAHTDPAAAGRPLTAMIFIRFKQHKRDDFTRWRADLSALPGVIAGWHLSGTYDYVVQVATESPDALRDFVFDHLSSHPYVTRVETSLVFDSVTGPGLF